MNRYHLPEFLEHSRYRGNDIMEGLDVHVNMAWKVKNILHEGEAEELLDGGKPGEIRLRPRGTPSVCGEKTCSEILAVGEDMSTVVCPGFFHPLDHIFAYVLPALRSHTNIKRDPISRNIMTHLFLSTLLIV